MIHIIDILKLCSIRAEKYHTKKKSIADLEGTIADLKAQIHDAESKMEEVNAKITKMEGTSKFPVLIQCCTKYYKGRLGGMGRYCTTYTYYLADFDTSISYDCIGEKCKRHMLKCTLDLSDPSVFGSRNQNSIITEIKDVIDRLMRKCTPKSWGQLRMMLREHYLGSQEN